MADLTNTNRLTAPDLREFMTRRKQEIKKEINSCLVGIIESFDTDEQTASVSVAFKKVIKGGTPLENGNAEDKVIDYPLLVRCPVIILNGGGSYLTFPISQGDECLLFFCDKDIDAWFQTGQIYQPNSERIHDLADGFALVGVKSLKNSLSYYTEGLKIYCGTGYITIDNSGNITVKGTTVNINPL